MFIYIYSNEIVSYSEYKQLLLISGDWIQDEKIEWKKNKSKPVSMLKPSQIVEITLDPKKAVGKC